MAEAFDTRELAAALDGDAGVELTITDLPNDVLVSIFEAVGDLRYVKNTPPPASARSGLSSTARRTRDLCTRRSSSPFPFLCLFLFFARSALRERPQGVIECSFSLRIWRGEERERRRERERAEKREKTKTVFL